MCRRRRVEHRRTRFGRSVNAGRIGVAAADAAGFRSATARGARFRRSRSRLPDDAILAVGSLRPFWIAFARHRRDGRSCCSRLAVLRACPPDAMSFWSPSISKSAASTISRWFAWRRRSNPNGYSTAPLSARRSNGIAAAERVEQVIGRSSMISPSDRGDSQVPRPFPRRPRVCLRRKLPKTDIGTFRRSRGRIRIRLRAQAAFAGIEIDVNAALDQAPCQGRSSFARNLLTPDCWPLLRPPRLDQDGARAAVPAGRPSGQGALRPRQAAMD